MNADDFRHLYEYHFTANRKIWNQCIVPLTDEQFLQPVNYSVGSIRNQVVHMLNIDDRWFSGLRGEPVPDFLNPEPFENRTEIREKWDAVEAKMRDYLQMLQADMLHSHPLGDELLLWQILIHVANHGTDHRAQLLRLLTDVGAATFPQDYFFFLIGKL